MRRMIRSALILTGVVGLLPVGAMSEPAAPAPKAEPANISDMTDALQRAQVRMTQGDTAAYPEAIELLKATGSAIAKAPPDTWKDKRQSDALVIFILSGGPLSEVVPLLRGEALPEAERPLARGALAYITGHGADALALLHSIDIGALDSRLAGQVAFARSLLQSKREPKAAIALLDEARLVAPGTLVEEAALRRELALLAEAHESERVALLTRQYVTRFPNSVYAPDFIRGFGRIAALDGLADDPAHYRLLSDAAQSLAPESKRNFLLGLAQAATVNARFDAAASAANEALQVAAPGSSEEARARLYLAAGRIFSDDWQAARDDLQNLSAAKLDQSDAALLASARSVSAQLRMTPAPGVIDAQTEILAKDRTGASATIASAEETLQRTSRLIEEPTP